MERKVEQDSASAEEELARSSISPEDDLSILGGGYQPKEPANANFDIPSGKSKAIRPPAVKKEVERSKTE